MNNYEVSYTNDLGTKFKNVKTTAEFASSAFRNIVGSENVTRLGMGKIITHGVWTFEYKFNSDDKYAFKAWVKLTE